MSMSSESQYPDYPLPKLTPEVIGSLEGDEVELGVEVVFKQARDKLLDNNNALYKAVGSFAAGALGPDADVAAITLAYDVMVMTHELLLRQAKADVFSEAFSTPTTGQ